MNDEETLNRKHEEAVCVDNLAVAVNSPSRQCEQMSLMWTPTLSILTAMTLLKYPSFQKCKTLSESNPQKFHSIVVGPGSFVLA